ncbi:helix-turn-helix transcriptional regulator [Aquabacterium sp.]|uniref:helix-turn-helix transcriptional regulator n=1 Tax=Aquabacterium sp. TaxID=1872578 RepID=UPI004037B258
MNESLPLTIREKTPKGGVTPGLSDLTKTERAVLCAVAQTGDYKSAATLLDCAVKTIENHVVRIHRKMGEPSTVRCVLLAERGGLLKGVA